MKESLQKLSLFSETQGLQTFLRRKKESPQANDIISTKPKHNNKRENIYKQFIQEQKVKKEELPEWDGPGNIYIIGHYNNANNIIFDHSKTEVNKKKEKNVKNIKVSLRNNKSKNYKGDSKETPFNKKSGFSSLKNRKGSLNIFNKKINPIKMYRKSKELKTSLSLSQIKLKKEFTPANMRTKNKRISEKLFEKQKERLSIKPTKSLRRKSEMEISKLRHMYKPKQKTLTKQTKDTSKSKLGQSLAKMQKYNSLKRDYVNTFKKLDLQSLSHIQHKTMADLSLSKLSKSKLWEVRKKLSKHVGDHSGFLLSNSSLQRIKDKNRESHTAFVKKLYKKKKDWTN